MPSTCTDSSQIATRLPALGVCQLASAWASSRASTALASLLRGFHLISQSTRGTAGWLYASMARISAAQSEPESRRARIGARGPYAPRYAASGQ